MSRYSNQLRGATQDKGDSMEFKNHLPVAKAIRGGASQDVTALPSVKKQTRIS
ncbi:hypothetical protein M378DRAFT_17002 [Amanita muscaria Koide BX008]|uniref:Uncharacterized protein n=1 Tax=Amanita muscaria (strain Koide BX008) TaxID=946122 RepID=A0A0C2W601_AMAMK|nr:hypothetical protein M378DRAFT_17002 [Amanita muscaria Koide BX008]